MRVRRRNETIYAFCPFIILSAEVLYRGISESHWRVAAEKAKEYTVSKPEDFALILRYNRETGRLILN